MNLNFIIKDLSLEQVKKLKHGCADCTFWFDTDKNTLMESFTKNQTVWGFLKSRIVEIKSLKNKSEFITFFARNGGIIKGAFSNRTCIGILLAGKYYLFPKLKSFNIYPPDNESIFLGCLHVIPEYKNLGVGKRLLISLEKDLIKNKVGSIESLGKRLNDDIDLEEYINSPIIPVKFLIKNGFYIKKNDELFPLLRLDLSAISLAKEFLKGKFALKNLILERAVKTPVIIKKNW